MNGSCWPLLASKRRRIRPARRVAGAVLWAALAAFSSWLCAGIRRIRLYFVAGVSVGRFATAVGRRRYLLWLVASQKTGRLLE